MSEFVFTHPKIVVSDLALEITQPLLSDEWKEIGQRFGRALKASAFVVGDWLVYGESGPVQLWFWPELEPKERVAKGTYAEAAKITGMDAATLETYAYVSRNVAPPLRNRIVSWEHHKKVAKLSHPHEQKYWLDLVADMQLTDKPISARRLSRSIEAGRLLTPEEMAMVDCDDGIDNVHPYVNGISGFWGRLTRGGWLLTADPEKRSALKRDLQPVVDIYQQL